jgi:uncharacterized protein (DUF305 family)
MQHKGHYGRLMWMVALSFAAMYNLMYAMVNSIDNVYNSINEVYMAGLMAAPMLLIELVLMSRMYPNKRLNVILGAASVGAAVLFWVGIRQQAGVSDQQFLRSMIPHHAGAILMCTRNQLQDPDLQQLCREIVSSQRDEIARMKAKLQ